MITMLEDKKFWSCLYFLLEKLNGPIDEIEVLKELDIGHEELKSYLLFAKQLGQDFELVDKGDSKFQLCPPLNKAEVNIKFSLFEWLQFQSHFPLFSFYANRPFHEHIKQKLTKLEDQFQAYDLFGPLEVLDTLKSYASGKVASIKHNHDKMLSIIEHAIIGDSCLKLFFLDNEKVFNVYPRKITYIDGDLNLVAEDTRDMCLINLNIRQFANVESVHLEYATNFSSHEVEDFLASIRAISDQDIRLIIKISAGKNIDLVNKYQFLQNPYMVISPHGDMRWAATVEPNHQLYDWIYQMGEDVEIIDPLGFKLDYEQYCADKLKKAS